MGEKTAKSDKAGVYEIGGLTAGVHEIIVKSPIQGYEASPQTVTITAGETKVVDIYLDWYQPKAIVEGHVYDETYRKPIAGTRLSDVTQFGLEFNDVEYHYGWNTHVDTPRTTNEQGYFRFDNAIAGDQSITVCALGAPIETRHFKASQNETTTLEFYLRVASTSCGICRKTILPGEERGLSGVTHYLCWLNAPICKKCGGKIVDTMYIDYGPFGLYGLYGRRKPIVDGVCNSCRQKKKELTPYQKERRDKFVVEYGPHGPFVRPKKSWE